MGLIVGLGTYGTIKLIGGGAALFTMIAGLQSLPDTAFRRKLSRLYRVGDICIKQPIKKKGKETGHRKIFPMTPLRNIQIYPDHLKATIILPDGMEPKMIWDHAFLFKQVFGEYVHLKQNTEKLFTLSVYPQDLDTFEYKEADVMALVQKIRVPVYAGLSRTGHVVYDMVDYPNLLIAGEPGSGKSVALRQIITTWLLHIPDLELYCVDLKRSEFHLFEDIAKQVVYDENGLGKIISKLMKAAKDRGDLLNKNKVSHVDDLPKEKRVPYIIVAIDEVAMLDSDEGKELLKEIAKLIAIGRALGIFFVMSMQRPDAKILDGKIKNCLTVRMAFRHTDITNSQISLGSGHTEAAEIKPNQKGRAALLLENVEYVQVPYLDLEEGRKILDKLKKTKTEEVQEAAQEDEEDDDL